MGGIGPQTSTAPTPCLGCGKEEPKTPDFRFHRGDLIHFEGKRWVVVKPGFRGNKADPYGPFVDIYVLRLDRKNAVEHRRDRADVDNRARLAIV